AGTRCPQNVRRLSPSAGPTPAARILALQKARRLRSRPAQCAPPAPETQRALRPRPQNPHRSRPTKQRPFLPAVSSLRGFRTPAPRQTPRACKGPASETLQRSRRSLRPSSLRRLRTAEIRTRSERESENAARRIERLGDQNALRFWRIPRPEGVKSR